MKQVSLTSFMDFDECGVQSILSRLPNVNALRETENSQAEKIHDESRNDNMADINTSNNSRIDDRREVETMEVNSNLGYKMYISPERQTAQRMCGWVDVSGRGTLMNDTQLERNRQRLNKIMHVCESVKNFERAAALAIFHCNLRKGIKALQRGSLHALKRNRTEEANALNIISMAVAGFAPRHRGRMDVHMQVNRLSRMTHSLVDVSESLDEDCSDLWSDLFRSATDALMGEKKKHPYLEAICAFLNSSPAFETKVNLANSESPVPKGITTVLNNKQLTLSDRIAFAARFLPTDQLSKYIDKLAMETRQSGSISGIIITGLKCPMGLQCLQAYVDRSGDVQTAALISAYIPKHYRGHSRTSHVINEWTECYRLLLNQWQLWVARAKLDVYRCQLLRSQESDESTAVPRWNVHYPYSGNLSSDSSLDVGVQPRCSSCGHCYSLHKLEYTGSSATNWLSQQKPIIVVCPNCHKPAPTCSICLMPMGLINPFVEMSYQINMQKKNQCVKINKPSAATETSNNSFNNVNTGNQHSQIINGITIDKFDVESLSTPQPRIGIGSWWTWCQTCNHGGHAQHLSHWFEKRVYCPVNGCNCKCWAKDRLVS